MERKRKLLIAIFAVVLLSGLGWLLVRPAEPFYEGKPLSYWLQIPKRVAITNLPVLGLESLEFPRVDSRAVPFLIKALDRRETAYDKTYQWLWNKSPQSVQKRLPKPVDAVQFRCNATIVLTKMGATARPAIPSLVRMLKFDPSDNARFSAATCLLAINGGDPAARAAMIEASTNDSSEGVRMIAGGVLRTPPVRRLEQSISAGTNLFYLEPKPSNVPLYTVPR